MAFSLLIMLICSACNASSTSADETIVLQLKWKHQFQFAGFYAAIKEGYFAEEGLNVTIREVDKQRSATQVVLSGDAQFGITDSSVVLARLEGQPLVVVAAIFQHSPMVLLTLGSSGISSPLALKNKRVMYQRNTDDAVLLAMFTQLGLTEYDHTHVAHDFRDDVLVNTNVDAMSAYITNQPYMYKEKNIPINVISPIDFGIDFYGDLLFVEEGFLRENKEKVLAFRRASLKGWKYAVDHQEVMVEWMLANLNTGKSRAHLLYEARNSMRLIQPEVIELGSFNANKFIGISEIYKQLGFAPLTGDIAGIDYQEYYVKKLNPNAWFFNAVLVVTAFFICLVFYRWIKREILMRQLALRKTHFLLKHY
ncbi:ABC transporter substrate-binding protein [Neptunomonas japonica]|uniref:ABC transporter substrate-binding protein n=1 Tax=Neptunomonas japonica TaxID=417574 RepID=UPI0012EBD6A3|nr:ABC transporter substrate-binding protein [Neptunomonas japonica]